MHNSFDCEGDHFILWFNDMGYWCLQKNAKVIKATKTLKPILQKLEFDGVIPELTETNNAVDCNNCDGQDFHLDEICSDCGRDNFTK